MTAPLAPALVAALQSWVDAEVDRRLAAMVADGRVVVVDTDEATKALDARFDVVPTLAARRPR